MALTKTQDVESKLPVHIGIIMDGNGRWAKKRFLPRSAGHRAGASNFRTITRYCSRIGIQYLTIYAFSTENWNRPAEEVGGLMRLFKEYLEEALRDFMDENIRVRFIGDVSAFPAEVRQLIEEVEEASAPKTGMVLNLAMNYGGRAEITRAAQRFAQEVQQGRGAHGGALLPVPLHRRPAGPGFDYPAQRGGAPLQFPVVAERLCRAGLLRYSLARL